MEVKLSLKKNNSVKWTKDVVYKVYCNDDLNTLPILILEDMKNYIEEVINSKLKGEIDEVL